MSKRQLETITNPSTKTITETSQYIVNTNTQTQTEQPSINTPQLQRPKRTKVKANIPQLEETNQSSSQLSRKRKHVDMSTNEQIISVVNTEDQVVKTIQEIERVEQPLQDGQIYITPTNTFDNLAKIIADNGNIYMGKDAALSGVIKHAKKYIDKLKQKSIIENELKIVRNDAEQYWDDMLSSTSLGQIYKLNNNTKQTQIKAVLSSLSFVKAIMDSACLGESVCIAIDNGLCESMKPFTDGELEQLIDIYMKVDTERDTGIKLLDFLLHMSYCDVYELCSSDILGAVNGLFSVRAIIDILPSMSYISIPKGAGGQIGTDSDIYLFSYILHRVFYKNPDDNIQEPHSFMLINHITTNVVTQLNSLINEINLTTNMFESHVTEFRRFENKYRGGICKDEAVLQSNADLCINIMKYITYISRFFINFKQTKYYKDLKQSLADNNLIMKKREPTKLEYDEDRTSIIREYLVWFSFQICRYIQANKFNNLPIYSIKPTASYIKTYLTSKKETYAQNLTTNRMTFQERWFDELKKVAINEAFAGHDNKSIELLKIGQQLYPTELGWTNHYIKINKKQKESANWDNIHGRIIKMVQGQTQGIFFQFSPVPNQIQVVRGSLFSLNTDLLDTGKVGGKNTSNGYPVYEIFTNNIGSKNIKLIVDLEKFTGSQFNTEKGKTLADDLTACLLSNRTHNYEDRFEEIISVISMLDRASRLPHPRAIFCNGCLNIPFNLPEELSIIITYKSFIASQEPVCEANTSSLGLNKYSFYTYAEPIPGDQIYKEILDECKKPREIDVFIALLLTYIVQNISIHYKSLEPVIKTQITNIQKKLIKQPTGTKTNKIIIWVKKIMNMCNDITITDNLRLLVTTVFEKFIDLNNEHVNGYKKTSAQRLAYLVGRNDINIASAFVEVKGKDNMEKTLNGDYFFINIVSGEFRPKLGSANFKYATSPVQQSISSFATVTSEFAVGRVSSVSSAGATAGDTTVIQQITQEEFIKEVTLAIGEEGIKAIENENMGEQPVDIELLLCAIILNNMSTTSSDLYQELQNDFIMRIEDEINKLISKLPLQSIYSDSIDLLSVDEFNDITVHERDRINKEIQTLEIRILIQNSIKRHFDEIIIAKKKRINKKGNPNPYEFSKSLLDIKRLGNLVKESKKEISELEAKKKYLEKLLDDEDEDEDIFTTMFQSGGQTKDISTLEGKLVLYKYDKKKNKYYITDFFEIFKVWFNTRYISTKNDVRFVKPASITLPSWFQQANFILKNDKRYKSLSKEQQFQIIKQYFLNVKKNKKSQMNDRQAIESALSIAFPSSGVPSIIKTEQDVSIKPFQSQHISQLQVPIEVSSGGTKKYNRKGKYTRRRYNIKMFKPVSKRYIRYKQLTRRK
jgi:hypothetical protein